MKSLVPSYVNTYRSKALNCIDDPLQRETLDAKYELLKTNLEDLEGGETHREGEEDETATLSGRTVRGSDEMLRSIGKRQFQPISRRSDPHF